MTDYQICIVLLTRFKAAFLLGLIAKDMMVHETVLQPPFGQTEPGTLPDTAAADQIADQLTAVVNSQHQIFHFFVFLYCFG